MKIMEIINNKGNIEITEETRLSDNALKLIGKYITNENKKINNLIAVRVNKGWMSNIKGEKVWTGGSFKEGKTAIAINVDNNKTFSYIFPEN